MNSNMLAGERRWASARRGGMTVLGKVAVPKPLNLPSQRLENHGLDPNVEIVPKGTLSWGSRPSSSGSNPWISSSLSPNGDGGTVSPSHLSGRASSGGSGTRPSTAGSDRTHEPVANAWGSNSRPSSSSGTMSSNQTSTPLRPRSAENRPNSSQLSRFADPVSKSSAVWGPSTTTERLGVKSSKEDGFSLSSGDFPTLGSEKDKSVKNVESEDHGRPSSASGRIMEAKEDTKDVKRGTVNTWKADGPRNAEDDIHPNMEKWQGDPHQYFNVNAPQRFDAWRGPPMNGPAGVWYGGRPQGPGFGGPVAPGGFPMEPFPYYRPQMAPPPIAGSQQVPPPGTGPRGPHPKNGDLYRPQMPDAYARPGMPFRPGFYRGPPGPMAFEGYYRPPMGYCNSERDIPYMGMAAGPPVYNGYPAPAPDIGSSHGRPAGHGPAGRALSEHDADHLEDMQGPKRIPLKNHNERDHREEGENPVNKMQPNVSYTGKSHYPTIYSRKNEWGAEEDTGEATFAKGSENYSHGYEHKVHAVDSTKAKALEGMGNVRTVNDNWTNKSDCAPSFPPDMPQLPLVSERESSSLTPTKNSELMHKIDGLNAKHRVSDIQNNSPNAYNRDEGGNGSQVVDRKTNNNNGGVSKTAGSFEKAPASVPHEVTVPVGDKPIQPMVVVSRRPYHGGQGRVEHRGKGKFNGQHADGLQRKPLTTESSSAVTATSTDSAPNIHLHGSNVVGEASENSMIISAGKTDGDSAEAYGSSDIQGQCDKRRELARQRALQLQKEEEERMREQKAKALAKLEELNRRTLTVDTVNQKAEKTQAIHDVHGEQEESRTLAELVVADVKLQEPALNLVSNVDVTTVDRDKNENQAGESIEVLRDVPLKMQQTGLVESNVSHLPMHVEAYDGTVKKVASQFNDGSSTRHKRPGYKQKQNNSMQKSMNEKSVSNVASEAQKGHTLASTIDVSLQEGPSRETKLSESNVPNTSNTVVEPSVNQRRKNNRSGKNKHKLDETPAVPALQPVMSNVKPEEESVETGELKDSLSQLDGSTSTVIEPDRELQARDVHSSFPNEESQSKVSNHWKHSHFRRLPRNQQSNRFMDKLHVSDTVVWAPVRTQNKGKGSVEIEDSQKPVSESANSTKAENMAQNSSKGKRAEMERYVPKPVAKELAQQGSIPPSSSSISSSRSNEGPGWEQSGFASSASVEISEDGSHNEHKKDHGAWIPRGSIDSSHAKVVHGPSSTSEPTKDIQQSKEPVESVKSKTNSATAETKASSIIDTSDGYNMANTTTAAAGKYPSAKDQGATGRGKRHPPRGSRSTLNNPDPDNTFSGEIDGSPMRSPAPDVNQKDRNVFKERSFGERTSSHWQPKSHSNSANNQHGNSTGSESVTNEVNRLPKKDHRQQKVQVASRHDMGGGSISLSQQGQSVNVKGNVAEESIVGHHQEFDREKKPGLAKGRPCSPNQEPVGSGESAPTGNKEDQLERNMPSGSRRNGRQNNRSIRGHESRGDWPSGHDHRPHDVPAFRDRQRQNVHYEYQPVGPSKGKKAEKVEEPWDGADSTDQRHRERGHNHSKRGGGNFYRR